MGKLSLIVVDARHLVCRIGRGISAGEWMINPDNAVRSSFGAGDNKPYYIEIISRLFNKIVGVLMPVTHILDLSMPQAAVNTPYMPLSSAVPLPQPTKAINGHSLRKLSLAVPTLREAENIPALITRIRTVLDPLGIPYEILVVDDDSCDGTVEVVTELARLDSRIRLLVRKGQRGLSGAILHGWRHTDAPILGVMDADLQHPPELLPQLVAAIEAGSDLVIGSRYTEGGGLGEWNPFRRLLSAAAVWVTWPVQRSGLRARDPMSGFFFVRRECLDRIGFQHSGFKLLLEILVRGRLRRVEEVPFAFGQRYRGASKANFKVAFDYGRLLARLYSTRFFELGRRRGETIDYIAEEAAVAVAVSERRQ
jgi:dolichol-phosphate mannosyltransferase